MVSIKDVARHAGVSHASVSRVLSNKPHVSDQLKRRVLHAVNELGYRPDATARRLREHGSSKVVGLIISDIMNPHFASIVRGVEDFAYETKMNIILCNTDGKRERQDFYVELMQAERAAGLIINPTNSETDGKSLDWLRESGTSIVLLDSHVEGYKFDVVMVDDREATRNAVSFLIERGYRKIAIIAGVPNLQTGQDRLQGYLDALDNANLPRHEKFIRYGNFRQNDAYNKVMDLLQAADKPDAIFTSSNMITIGALTAIQELGMKVPDDIAVIGFDDLPDSHIFFTPLTAVSQPSYDIGREALRLLRRRIDEPDAAPMEVVLDTQLVTRKSVGTKGIGSG